MPESQKILTLDVGTTSIKACVFDNDLKLLAETSQEYELLTSSGNIVEAEPEEYWNALKVCISRLRENAELDADEIGAISISSQGETLICVDADRKPVGNAIVWIDARAETEAETLRCRLGQQEYYRVTGMTDIWGTTPLSKLMWLRIHEPQRYAKTDKLLLLSDYLVLRLTGQIASERTMMSSTGYWNIFDNTLWTDALCAAGIDPLKIPPVYDCREILGHITPQSAEELGLSVRTAVVIGGNDQICGQLGAGNLNPGMITETTGTALTLITVLDRENIPDAPRFDVYLHANGKYLALIYTKTAAIVLKWFKDNFCEKEQQLSKAEGRSVYELLDELADKAPAGSDGMVLYPHFEGKFAPDSIPGSTGMIYGIRLGSTRESFIRAIMEGVAYMLRENTSFLLDCGIDVQQFVSLGGGSKSDVWEQIKSDVLQKRFHTLEVKEAASVGAAAVARTALGLCNTLEESCEQCARFKKTFLPRQEYRPVYDANYKKYKKIDLFMKNMK